MKKAKSVLQRGTWEATLRNVRALKKQLAALALRVRKLEKK